MLRVLNLYSGIGGNRRLWENVQVTAVENHPKVAKVYSDNFPDDTVIVGDAIDYLEKNFREFDFIWSSPPCQSHSKMQKVTRHSSRKLPDMSLYGQIIFLRDFFKGKWAVENVVPFYEPLIVPTVKLDRHLFWASSPIAQKEFTNPVDFYKSDLPSELDRIKKLYGIHYDKNIYFPGKHSPGQVLRNCVTPEMGKYVFESVLGK